MSHVFSVCVDCGNPMAALQLIEITPEGWRHYHPCTAARRAEHDEGAAA